MKDINKFARSTVTEFPEVTVPKTIEEIMATNHLARVALLNCNENPLGTAPQALEAIADELSSLNRYPESGSTVLRAAIADHYGLDKENVIVANGGDNIITTLMNAFIDEADEIVVGDPYFFVYGVESGILGGKIVKVPAKDFQYDLDGILAAITPQTKLIIITNPNNPTATIIGRQAMADFMSRVPADVLVVLDEAYAEFVDTDDYPDSIEYIKSERNLLVIRTFSKLYGLAGLRIGYALGRSDLIANMRRVIETFPVNRLAQAAATAALNDTDFVQRTIKLANENRAYLTEQFEALGLEVVKGYANFMFVDLKQDSLPVTQALADKGIMIKNGHGWGYPNHARISFGTPDENQWLVKELRAILDR